MTHWKLSFFPLFMVDLQWLFSSAFPWANVSPSTLLSHLFVFQQEAVYKNNQAYWMNFYSSLIHINKKAQIMMDALFLLTHKHSTSCSQVCGRAFSFYANIRASVLYACVGYTAATNCYFHHRVIC